MGIVFTTKIRPLLILTGCPVLFIFACDESSVATVGKPALDFGAVNLNQNIW
jgi:hypothetical protein